MALQRNLVDGTESQYSFDKRCFSHKLFVTLLSVVVSNQKGIARVSKLFNRINLDGRQSRPVNDRDRVATRQSKRFRNSEMLMPAQQKAK